MPTANISHWLRRAEKVFGEQIEAVVVGRHDSRAWDEVGTLPDEGVLLSRETGLAKLDVDYDSGFGGADCFPMYAWTASRVFFITEYDGATGVCWIPRDPIALLPQFNGQDGWNDQ